MTLSQYQSNRIRLNKLAQSSLLIALALSTSYILISIPNVKLIDSLVFLASTCLGTSWGVLVASLIWLIYGTINPLGLNPFMLFAVLTGELVFVGAGKMANRFSNFNPIMLGLLGGASTLAYDLYTNVLVGILIYGSIWAGIMTMNFPYPMGLIHQVSNVIMFATVVPLLRKIMLRRGTGKVG